MMNGNPLIFLKKFGLNLIVDHSHAIPKENQRLKCKIVFLYSYARTKIYRKSQRT